MNQSITSVEYSYMRLAYEVSQLSFSYHAAMKSTPVLYDININIRQGEFVAIVGASGSGKSTLLHLLGAMLTFESGNIKIHDASLAHADSRKLAQIRAKHIGFVFQQFHLLPKLNVLDNILLPMNYPINIEYDRKALRQKAHDIAKEVGIAHRLDHYPKELSGGEQQRVAIARALMRNADIILADEPTGNLDSHNTQNIMALLTKLNQCGKTIILVTHDKEIAEFAPRTIEIKDGRVLADIKKNKEKNSSAKQHMQENKENKENKEDKQNREIQQKPTSSTSYTHALIMLFVLACRTLMIKKGQTLLTALGVIIGVASIIVMMTLGQYAKDKILASYDKLGAKTVLFYAYKNWMQSASDHSNSAFSQLSVKDDLTPIKRIFPQITMLSPSISSYATSVVFNSNKVHQNQIPIQGVNTYFLPIVNTPLAQGHNFSALDIQNADNVCIIGHDINRALFPTQSAIGNVIQIGNYDGSYTCFVIGVLKEKSSASSDAWNNINMQILLPFTYLQKVNWSFLAQFYFSVDDVSSVIPVSDALKNYFTSKYGNSGTFMVSPDIDLLHNIQTFLNIFTLMLAVISIVSLIVAGIGITNMMLASISENLYEIGLLKAIGAGDRTIFWSYLVEAILLCLSGGIIGFILGVGSYELILYIASKFVQEIQFIWFISPFAVLLAFISVVSLGVLSGLLPARKAASLDVVKCLNH
ncbi:ABC transporter permease [Cysteiniphilum halobium]|uniref:ABC transporter permease n=1 Tax=Cysteiniphilum halobium TaxID=2219059 RepID=UPI0013C2F8B3|nr:ABC transporter permease [Cysteiniphilum halobium]